jgi:uncharacterized protein (DUF305 family)
MAHNVRHIFTAALFALWAVIAFGQKPEALADGAIIVQPGAPGESSKTLTTAPPSVPARVLTEADVRFMQGMIHHHSQAVEMTDLLRTRGRDKNLQELGKRISISQTDEIQFMRQWLQDRGKPVPMEHMNHMAMDHMAMTHESSGSMSGMDMSPMPMMPGMLSPQQMDALAKATGRPFDRLFLTGMIQHHRGALVMVQDLFETAGAGQDNVLYDFATDIDNTQRAEIEIMQRMLKEMK